MSKPKPVVPVHDSSSLEDDSDPLLNPNPDPWEDTETAHLRAFLKLTPTERFHLLIQAIEFMHKLRPPEANFQPPQSNSGSPTNGPA